MKYLRRTEPTRRLFDPNPDTRLQYRSSVHTNIGRTFSLFQPQPRVIEYAPLMLGYERRTA